MRLGQIPLAQPGNRILEQRRHLGQADVLTVQVKRDGIAAPGVAVEVMLADGSRDEGVTDEGGTYAVSYGSEAFGMATVLITPPADVQDMGEDTAQGVDLAGGTADVLFEMHSIAPVATMDETKGLVAGIATVVLLTIFGASL